MQHPELDERFSDPDARAVPWGEARPLEDALAEVDCIGVNPDLVWR